MKYLQTMHFIIALKTERNKNWKFLLFRQWWSWFWKLQVFDFFKTSGPTLTTSKIIKSNRQLQKKPFSSLQAINPCQFSLWHPWKLFIYTPIKEIKADLNDSWEFFIVINNFRGIFLVRQTPAQNHKFDFLSTTKGNRPGVITEFSVHSYSTKFFPGHCFQQWTLQKRFYNPFLDSSRLYILIFQILRL